MPNHIPPISGPPVVDEAQLSVTLDWPSLIERSRRAFLDPIRCPPRLVIERGDATLLVMAAARDGGAALTKTVTVTPAGVAAQAMLTDRDGALVALLDGETLTRRRTAAASALAASVLARPDARVLAVLGAGPQAAALARCHAASRSFERVLVWARRPDAARAFAQALAADSAVPVTIADSARAAVAEADIVTVATRATAPLVRLADVRLGTHVDLVGGYRPAMREADDALIGHARVVADCAAALAEAGDLAVPLAAGVCAVTDIELFADVLAGSTPRAADEITVFKSVGFAALDLVAAELAIERMRGATR